jgi:hypothetical protein
MGNAVYESDSGLSSVSNVNGSYSSYSNCAFLVCACSVLGVPSWVPSCGAAIGRESSLLSRSLRGIAYETWRLWASFALPFAAVSTGAEGTGKLPEELAPRLWVTLGGGYCCNPGDDPLAGRRDFSATRQKRDR